MKVGPLLQKGACFLVRDGADIRILDDPWILTLHAFKPTPRVPGDLRNCNKVQDLMEEEMGGWDVSKVRAVFDQRLVVAILKVKIPVESWQDELIWLPEKSDKFSIGSSHAPGTGS